MCTCDEDFCNSPVKLASEDIPFPLVEPEDTGDLTCYECGTAVGTDGSGTNDNMNITCDGMSTCKGVACLTSNNFESFIA